MKYRIFSSVFLIATCLLSCQKATKPTTAETRPVETAVDAGPTFIPTKNSQKNPAAHLTLTFDGSILDSENLEKRLFPDKIYLESDSSQKTEFTPIDPTSIQQSAFIIEPAWSPDGSWLLLPEGRFEGFSAFKTTDLPANLNTREKALRIAVTDTNGTKWWHEFEVWKSPSKFEFKAGLSGDYFVFEYDLNTQKITPIDAPLGGFKAVIDYPSPRDP